MHKVKMRYLLWLDTKENTKDKIFTKLKLSVERFWIVKINILRMEQMWYNGLVIKVKINFGWYNLHDWNFIEKLSTDDIIIILKENRRSVVDNRILKTAI